jgi:hypothetical protein
MSRDSGGGGFTIGDMFPELASGGSKGAAKGKDRGSRRRRDEDEDEDLSDLDVDTTDEPTDEEGGAATEGENEAE